MNVIVKGIISAFFPKTCVCCGEPIEEEEELCEYCREMLYRFDPLTYCIRCSRKKRDCICKSRLFFYNACIAPFFNIAAAKQAMYRLKFSRKPFVARFFAEQMALCVKNEYRKVLFDVICYVPMPKKRERSRGYNQSRLLAQELSKILHIPVQHDLVVCHKRSAIQHDLPVNKRAQNVFGLYTCTKDYDGKTVLLVDDIKTSGATLNECAKQLTIAGASAVYCVTGLITEKEKKPQNRNGGKRIGNRNRN